MARAKSTKRNRQRPHEPWRIGARVYKRGRYYHADFRYIGMGRFVLLNPDAPGWPKRGEPTEFADVAERWKWRYADHYALTTHSRQLGHAAPDDRRLADAVAAYLEHRTMTVEPNTVRNDRAALGLLATWCGADAGVATITAPALQQHFNGLRRAGYKPATLELRRVNMQAFLEWCGRKGDANPARLVEIAAVVKHDARAFTDEELAELRTFATTMDRKNAEHGPDSWRLWLEVCVCTGARMGEAMALEWSAFAHASRTVRLTQQLDQRGTGTKEMKGKASRTVLVLPELWRFVKRGARGRVLTPQIGAGTSRFGSQRWAHRFYELAGIKRTSDGWHVWRHTYARLFLERGGTMEELQRSLGHASIATTQTTYGHFSSDKAASSARGRIYGRA